MRRYLCIVMCCWVLIASAQDVLATSGNVWMELPEHDKQMYVIGVVSAFIYFIKLARIPPNATLSPVEQMVNVVVSCLERRSMYFTQVVAIAEQYMKHNPSEWDSNMSGIIRSSLEEACER